MRRPPHLGPLLLVAAVAVALGLGIYSGVRARSVADGTLKNVTAEAAIAVVNVVSPTPNAAAQEILLPGTTQAFTDASIFARTNGYVKAWYFDIGAHVKQGQLLAVIETPESWTVRDKDRQLLVNRLPGLPWQYYTGGPGCSAPDAGSSSPPAAAE